MSCVVVIRISQRNESLTLCSISTNVVSISACLPSILLHTIVVSCKPKSDLACCTRKPLVPRCTFILRCRLLNLRVHSDSTVNGTYEWLLAHGNKQRVALTSEIRAFSFYTTQINLDLLSCLQQSACNLVIIFMQSSLQHKQRHWIESVLLVSSMVLPGRIAEKDRCACTYLLQSTVEKHCWAAGQPWISTTN